MVQTKGQIVENSNLLFRLYHQRFYPKEVIDEDNNYVGTVTQAPDVEASTTVEYIKKYLDGEEFDKIVPISAGIYCDEGQLTAEEVEESAK